jgi:hypothetical protein
MRQDGEVSTTSQLIKHGPMKLKECYGTYLRMSNFIGFFQGFGGTRAKETVLLQKRAFLFSSAETDSKLFRGNP